MELEFKNKKYLVTFNNLEPRTNNKELNKLIKEHELESDLVLCYFSNIKGLKIEQLIK